MSIDDSNLFDIRTIGLAGTQSPGNRHCSAPRLGLAQKHGSQAQVMDNGGDFPFYFTGYESIIGDYTFDSTRRKNPIVVISIIDKYPHYLMNSIRPGTNPLRTVIYRDLVTNEINYFNISRYTSFSDDYGYRMIPRKTIHEGDVINPDEELVSSPIKKGKEYCPGINARFALMTMPENTEDCFAMSESFADKIAPLSIETKSLSFTFSGSLLLNLYGKSKEDIYRIIPDLGDKVRSDGILCASRPLNNSSILCDFQYDNLCELNTLFDKPVYAHPGAEVVDITVITNNASKIPPIMFEQLRNYHNMSLTYWENIVKIYYKHRDSYQIGFKFNTLVTQGLSMLYAAGRPAPTGQRFNKQKIPRITLVDKFNVVQLRVDITLMYRNLIHNGFKIAGRYGDKGVIKVIPDKQMPLDEQGNRADLCGDPIGVAKRLNIEQLYEMYITRLLYNIAQDLDVNDFNNSFERVVDVLNDINPEYAEIIRTTCITDSNKQEYVKECHNTSIHICIPPLCKYINMSLIEKLQAKYNVPIGPVAFDSIMANGDVQNNLSNIPVLIGFKYISLLAQFPKPMSSGFGYVNSCHMPIASPDKDSYPIGSQPVRWGEAETRIITISTRSLLPLIRIRNLFGNSTLGPKTVIREILESKSPETIRRYNISDEELSENNLALGAIKHILLTTGKDLVNVVLSEEQANPYFETMFSDDKNMNSQLMLERDEVQDDSDSEE